MSGGAYDHFWLQIEHVAERLMASRDPTRHAFGLHLLKVSKAMHDIEWVDSDDSAPGDEYTAILKCISQEHVLESLVEDAKKIVADIHKITRTLESERSRIRKKASGKEKCRRLRVRESLNNQHDQVADFLRGLAPRQGTSDPVPSQ